MQIHQIQPIHKRRKSRRIGRGGRRGTYSGRGIKGQRSRAGYRLQPKVRELLKKYPKLRGYKRSVQKSVVVLNLTTLEEYFKKGETVNPDVLAQKKIIGTIKQKTPGIKILGDGEITKPLIIENCKISKSAKEKVERAGGTIK